MTGFLLIAVVITWAIVANVIATRLVSRLQPDQKRRIAYVVVLVVLLVVPLADEIVGGFQFRALCRKNGRYDSAFAKVEGRTVVFSSCKLPHSDSTVLTTYARSVCLLDPQTRSVVASYVEYNVKGGWFIRVLGISETNAPLTFGNSCRWSFPESVQDAVARNHVKLIFDR
jgi:hypothetical protein